MVKFYNQFWSCIRTKPVSKISNTCISVSVLHAGFFSKVHIPMSCIMRSSSLAWFSAWDWGWGYRQERQCWVIPYLATWPIWVVPHSPFGTVHHLTCRGVIPARGVTSILGINDWESLTLETPGFNASGANPVIESSETDWKLLRILHIWFYCRQSNF